MSEGRVYLVGGGPGDPGLLTLRGRELLEQAEVVVYDALILPRLLDFAPAAAERIYVGKRAAAHALPQDQINALLVERGRRGQIVVRLKGGDPYVFGRGGEEALALEEAGIAYEEVPGITAGVAAPAYAGIPVTHREVASAVGFITGHEADDKDDSSLDWAAIARWPGTLVFFMGISNLGRICDNLTRHGLRAETPAAVIRYGTTAKQQTVVATVGGLAAAVETAGLKPPALIVVGGVAALHDKLNWFERRPLFRRTVLVTRSREQASALTAQLAALGAEVIEAPTIRIAPPEDATPLRQAARDAAGFDWIVFTSPNAVEAFFAALDADNRDARALAKCRLCAVGPATATRLAAHGLRADAMPETFNSAAVGAVLAAAGDLRGQSIIWPRADIAPLDLSQELSARGAAVTDVVAYRTIAECPEAEEIKDRLARGEIDWLTFTSSSTAKNLVAAVGAAALAESGARIASIGPSTSATLRELGLAATVEADPHTPAALVESILAWEVRQPQIHDA